MIVDSHCHLDFPQFENQLDEIVKRARGVGVRVMVTISTKISEAEKIIKITERFDDVFCSVGTHPHNANDENEMAVSVEELVKLSDNDKVVAIGEAGLDYHYEKKEIVGEAQAQGLKKHIEAARITGLPLVIHSRDADEDMINILQDEHDKGAFPAVLHCFSSTPKLAQKGIELGMYISFSGILTFKNSEELRNIARQVPKDKVLVETDAPYLAPVPHRGETNEPAFVIHTANELAKIWESESKETYNITTTNFLRLFKKMPKIK